MKVGFVSYAALWQRSGGLQVQMTKTMQHLRQLGVSCSLINPVEEKFNEFDLLHLFSSAHGTYSIAEEARRQNVKVIVSPVLQIEMGVRRKIQIQLASRLAGKLSGYEIKTTYDQTKQCLDLCHHIVALSESEKSTINNLYGERSNVTVIPNGIDSSFFNGDSTPHYPDLQKLGDYVLVVGAISAYKNQLGVIQSTNRNVVLVGPIHDNNYFEACMKAGSSRVLYIGLLAHNDPKLRSAYANAKVTVLASQGEAFGMAAAESLACGTPAIITKKNGLGLFPSLPLLQFVDTGHPTTLATAIGIAMSTSESERLKCKSLVEHFDWSVVATSLKSIYTKSLAT